MPPAFRRWTAEEDAIVRREYLRVAASVLAEVLSRTTVAVKRRVYVLGLPLPVDDDGRVVPILAPVKRTAAPLAPAPLPASLAEQYVSVWNGRDGLSGYQGGSSLNRI